MELGERKFNPVLALLLRFAEKLADQIVRLTERNAFANEVICSFGRKKSGIGGEGAEFVVAELRSLYGPAATASMSATWS